MLLITIFVELRVVAGRSRTRACSPQAVSRRPCCAVVLRRTAWSEHGMDAAWAWHGKCESDTAALLKSNGKDTARHGRGTTWARHGHGMLCVNRLLGHLNYQECNFCISVHVAQRKTGHSLNRQIVAS